MEFVSFNAESLIKNINNLLMYGTFGDHDSILMQMLTNINLHNFGYIEHTLLNSEDYNGSMILAAGLGYCINIDR